MLQMALYRDKTVKITNCKKGNKSNLASNSEGHGLQFHTEDPCLSSEGRIHITIFYTTLQNQIYYISI